MLKTEQLNEIISVLGWCRYPAERLAKESYALDEDRALPKRIQDALDALYFEVATREIQSRFEVEYA